jgi:hypothetical protein
MHAQFRFDRYGLAGYGVTQGNGIRQREHQGLPLRSLSGNDGSIAWNKRRCHTERLDRVRKCRLSRHHQTTAFSCRDLPGYIPRSPAVITGREDCAGGVASPIQADCSFRPRQTAIFLRTARNDFLDRLCGILGESQTRCFAWALLPKM